MQGIRNIIFDLGGVILNLDNRRTEEAFTGLGVKNIRQYFGLGHAASFFKDYEVGKITDQQFVDAIRELTGPEVSDEAIIDAWNALLLDFPPERIQLLRSLGKSYRIFLFSNTNALHLAALQKIYADTLLDRKNWTIISKKTYYSHLLGMRKPEKASYEHIINAHGLNGAETLFVDDAIINVEGAETAGLKGLYLRPGITLLDFQW